MKKLSTAKFEKVTRIVTSDKINNRRDGEKPFSVTLTIAEMRWLEKLANGANAWVSISNEDIDIRIPASFDEGYRDISAAHQHGEFADAIAQLRNEAYILLNRKG